jgi:tRNA A-37 threonylcarbamoyl transferase component Bud32
VADGAPTAIGMVLGEAYRLTREIGRGGMGAVYEGVHLRLNRRVAVKLMARELAMNTEALARFRREAEVTSQLGHPHIVQVFDFGEAPTGEPYLVMEFLEGEDLDARLRRTGRQPVALAVHVVKQIASALAATHAKGIVHRDLKPANVFMLSVEGVTDFVKVVDFGISKVKAATTRLTAAAAVMGTPNYMSPEQAAGRIDEIDSATDQWALACIAYELLAGRPPFVGDSIASLLYQVVHEAPSPLAASTHGLPSGLQDVLSCALSKKPAERFASVAAFARAFEGAATGVAVAASPPSSAATAPTGLAMVPPGLSVPRVATEASPLKPAATTFSAAAGEAMSISTAARAPGAAGQRRLLAGVGALAVAGLAVGAVALTRPRGAVAPVVVSASAAPPSAPPAPVAAPTPPPVAPAVAPAPAEPVAAPTPASAAATARPTPAPGEDQAPAPTRTRHRKAKGTTADGAQASASSAPSSSAVAPAADAPTWPPQPKTAPADAPTWPPQPKAAADAPTWPPQPKAAADAPAWPPPQGTGAADGAKPPKQRRHLMQRIFGD